jgi:hypothetical protein
VSPSFLSKDGTKFSNYDGEASIQIFRMNISQELVKKAISAVASADHEGLIFQGNSLLFPCNVIIYNKLKDSEEIGRIV